MSHKSFTCSICGASVTKPKSYALSNGQRACRTHAEASAAHDAREQENADRIEAEKNRQHEDRLRKEHPFSPRCFCCGCVGMLQQEFFMRRLIAMDVAAALHNDPAASLPWDKRSHIEGISPDRRVLVAVKMPENKMRHLRLESRLAVQVCNGNAMLCIECAKKMEIKTPLDEITFEQVKKLAAILPL